MNPEKILLDTVFHGRRVLLPTMVMVTTVTVLLFVSGCASRITLDVNAYRPSNLPRPLDKHYILRSAMKEISPEDPGFQKISAFFISMLADRGYILVTDRADANLEIFLQYAISERRKARNTLPNPDYDYVQSDPIKYTFVDVNGNPSTGIYQPPATVKNVSVTGEHGSYYYYHCTANLEARIISTNPDSQHDSGNTLWNTHIYSAGSSGDLLGVIPYMAEAAKPYIESNAGRLTVTLDKSDMSRLDHQ